MDSVTHVLLGALTYYVLPKTYRVKGLLLTSIILASLPDFDVFFTYTPELYLRWHRGISHSLLFAVLLPLLLTPLVRYYSTKHNPKWTNLKIYSYITVLLLTHIYYDLVTSYGTMIFLPFSSERIRFPALFIIDPILLLGLCIGIFYGWKHKRSIAIKVAILLVLYPICMFSVGKGIEFFVQNRYASLLDPKSTIRAYPAPFAPLYWSILIEESESYYITTLNSITKNMPALLQYSKISPTTIQNLIAENTFFATYFAFAHQPIAIESTQDYAILAPLRFASFPTTLFKNNSIPFTVTLHISNNSITSFTPFTSAFPYSYTKKSIPFTNPIPLRNSK